MYSDKCRICLESTNELISLFSVSDSSLISLKITGLTKIEIYPNDGLPNSICTVCNKKLDDCIQFVKLCQQSDYDLKLLRTITEKDGMNVNKSNVNEECSSIKIENRVIEKDYSEVQVKDNNECELRRLPQKQQCFTCGKIMSSRFRLKTHLATHLEVKPHTCSYCKKKFTIVENLNTHMRTHTGEKPFCCAVCGKTFAQSSGLIVHKRKHSGQTPYQCTLCPRSFQTFSNLRYHVRVHTGEKNYDCGTCGRAFITRSDLKQHQITHSGEKPNVCSICGLRFSRASNLKRHVGYVHTVKKSYPCEQCPSIFEQKAELAKHKKSHINNKTIKN